MKKTPQQMLPRDTDIDALLDRLKRGTKQTKRHIGNDMIRTEAKRRKLIPAKKETPN